MEKKAKSFSQGKIGLVGWLSIDPFKEARRYFTAEQVNSTWKF
jgi:hypothetical protein